MSRIAPDTQLIEIAEIFNAAELRWWIDSGTLLALYRDGRVFPKHQDPDIDLGCSANQTDRLADALQQLRKLGYRIGRRRYRGSISKYWIRPPWFSGKRALDLKLYSMHEHIATCPVGIVRIQAKQFLRRYLAKLVTVPVSAYWRRHFSRSWRFRAVDTEFRVATLYSPVMHFSSVETIAMANVAIPIPAETNEYLEFRFGNWRTPTTNWKTVRDDGGLLLEEPQSVVARIKPTPSTERRNTSTLADCDRDLS